LESTAQLTTPLKWMFWNASTEGHGRQFAASRNKFGAGGLRIAAFVPGAAAPPGRHSNATACGIA
jgi:hypothetical protein